MGFLRRVAANAAATELHRRYYEEMDRLCARTGRDRVDPHFIAMFHLRAWCHAQKVPSGYPTPPDLEPVAQALLTGFVAATPHTMEQVTAELERRDEEKQVRERARRILDERES